MNGILKWLGGFVQQTLATNTAKEIASDIADMHYKYKLGQAIWSFSITILMSGGGATLFVLEPSIANYMRTIVLQAFPFLGPVASMIGVGIFGAWFFGAAGNNIAKETARYFEARGGKHTNAVYNTIDQTVPDIIKANLDILNPNLADLEQGLQFPALQGLDQKMLSDLLNSIVKLIDEHRDDGTTAHADYKRILLAALRQLDLRPLGEMLNKNDAKRESRIESASHLAEVLGLNEDALNNPFDRDVVLARTQEQNARRALNHRRDYEEAVAVEEVRENNNNEPLRPNPQAQHEPQMIPVHVAQSRPKVYRNTLQYYRNLNNQRVVDPRRARPITSKDPDFELKQDEILELKQHVLTTIHQQRAKQEAGRRMAVPLNQRFTR